MTHTAPRAASATAPSNIAFVKYWGARDLERAVPLNPSISMTLSACVSRCEVQPLPGGEDEVLRRVQQGRGAERTERASPAFAGPVLAHLERIRRRTGVEGAFRIVTGNSFPDSAGLASSASGFAALTLALARAMGLRLTAAELSDLARRSGSGSAARSVFGGYVEWPAEQPEELAEASAAAPGCPAAEGSSAAARPLARADHWDLRDVIGIVNRSPKPVSSREGHRRAVTSPYLGRRLEKLPERLARVREAIERRDIGLLGPTLEEEAVDLHLIAMSSRPPIFYWQPGTLEIFDAVRALRADGLAAYFTVDAGPNVHVICLPEGEETVAMRLAGLSAVERVIRDGVGDGPS
ncbi:MAG: diphosphomevalonate decarboxylase [Gemmatimonadota bacterium]